MAISVKIDQALKARIDNLASARDRTSHWIMREAIQKYIEQEEARESFKQEALASWEEFQETGLHLRGQEVQDWLKTWGTKNEAQLPPLHE